MAQVKRTHNLDHALEKLERAAGLALKGGGLILQQRMQERSPLLTGRLMRSIHTTDPQIGADGVTVLVGPTVAYSIYLEELPWIIGKRPGPKSQIKGATIPFMRPALKDTRAEIIAFIEDGLRVAVRALGR